MAGSGYKFYRNVKDYGADDRGVNDSVEAINAAIADGKRCGGECGNTFTKGAIIYFPVRFIDIQVHMVGVIINTPTVWHV